MATPSKVPIPIWFQGLAALALLGLALAGGAVAWGQLTTEVSADHDLIIRISDDIEEIKLELRQQETARIKDSHKADLERADLHSRLRYLETEIATLKGGSYHADQ